MKLKALQFIMATETIAGTYRNFCNYKKKTKFLILVRLFVELILAITNIVIRSHYKLYAHHEELFYFIFLTVNLAIILPFITCWTSSTFQKLLKSMETQQKYFIKNTERLDNLYKKHKYLTWVIGLILMAKLGFSVLYWVQEDLYMPYIHLVLFCILLLQIYLSEFKYIYEFIAINCILYVIALQLSCITESIDEEISYIVRVGNLKVKNSAVSVQYRIKLLDKWSKAYRNVKKSSNIFNSVFDFQLSVTLLSTFVYYILLLYTITSLSVSGTFKSSKKFLYVSTLLSYLIVIYLVSLAAQQCENNYLNLRRKLSTLLIHCVTVPECREATRNLLRVVTTRPLRIEAYGGVAVDMSLLPNFIALCTSYTYVALQFNKII